MIVENSRTKKWIIGITGSSGMPYALRLVDVLSQSGTELHLVFSEAALRVLQEEMEMKFSQSTLSSEKLLGEKRENIFFYNPKDIAAWFASGSAPFDGVVVVPTSMATLGMIANSCGHNLIHRAADVAMKEGRRLIMVPRETPLSPIHLENMLKLSKLGVNMVPAMPGFYHKPANLESLVDMMVMKILDVMGIESQLVQRWRQGEPLPSEKRGLVLSYPARGA
ncbi:MAG: UbiX family flavin prenyltransferase [Deltaproteobacteria bacterium]|nr:UbiX family flavin prenyltransferase [Deltaproteobacteria bacterium]